MDFENENLKFQHLTGGNILEYAPLYSRSGEHLLFITKNSINIYSTVSGHFVRKLEGSEAPFIDFEFELQNDNILIACNKRGELFSWEWKTGVQKNTITMPPVSDKRSEVTNFKLLNLYNKSDLAIGFVCFKIANESIKCRLLNRATNSLTVVPFDLRLTMKRPIVAVDNKNFPNLVLSQGHYIYFINYKTWSWVRLLNAHKIPITAVQIHPSEECVATGDEHGKVFLWREFSCQKTVKTSLYHWHHTQITSICFSRVGANFYSSGEESVLVKWHIENPEFRQFIPRTPAEIRHVVTSPDNTLVVACLVDNSVQFYGTEMCARQNLQEFTFITDDKTNRFKYPTGLRLNPRNNSLVLNGRIGSLQFYNTYNKSLLYNVNIVNQNLMSKEREKILYNINVTKAAFNIDWMVTGEVFDDEQHLPELRLKFWQYQEETQNYVLNTNIELPHEGGFKAIEFSNDYQVENLLCATVGDDNIIKIWSLDDSNNIYKKGKSWFCIAQTVYKNLPVDSISFSQDGSLLAAGYGNILCIYKSDNLKLKAALTGSNGLDGCITKAQIRIPSKSIDGSKSGTSEKRKKLFQLFTNMFEANDESLIKELQISLKEKKSTNESIAKLLEEQLDDQQKFCLYQKIVQQYELNLFQKVLIFQKLGIACKVHPQMQMKLAEYLGKLLEKRNVEHKLHTKTHCLNLRQRFKAKYRLQQHCKQQQQYDDKITKNLVPILSVMNLGTTAKTKSQTQINCKKMIDVPPPPAPTMAEISHVQFAAGEYAHLVIVCMEQRVLIWNLLTLRLQAVLKLSVKHLTFDPQTNLAAVVTHNNELHLFQPNVPLPIYQRRDLPLIHGMAWIPRRYPKQRSINVDWQAQSTLYFLNEYQEIVYLSSTQEKEPDAPAPIIFENVATNTINYTTFGTYATKSVKDTQTVNRRNGPIVLGNSDKTAVKTLIDMSVHTMPPMSMLCEDFIKSMVKSSDTKALHYDAYNRSTTDDNVLTTRLNGDVNGYDDSQSDEESEKNEDTADLDTKLPNGFSPVSNSSKDIRKDLMKKMDELKRNKKSLSVSNPSNLPASNEEEESILRKLSLQVLSYDF